MVAELLHGQVALLLTEITMQRLGIIAVLDEFVGNLLCFQFCATEDDGEDTWIEIDDTLQCQVFVLSVHHIIYMVNVLSTLVTTTHHNLLVVM